MKKTKKKLFRSKPPKKQIPIKLHLQNHYTFPDAVRLPLLDLLRFFAIFCVLTAHFGTLHWLHWIGLDKLQFGSIGVCAFFVLSGFLITGILLRYRDRIDLGEISPFDAIKAFYIRRAFRIFPAYYLILLICLIGGVTAASNYYLWFVTYTTNIGRVVTENRMFPLGHFWTLAVEEQFYLIWPLFTILAPRRLVLPLILTVIFVGLATRLILMEQLPEKILWLTITPACFDSLGLGALLAYIRMYTNSASQKAFTVGICAIGFLVGAPTLKYFFFNLGGGH
jgi:peptidoglycan/LPS O-acetylase OafA/YrhL